MLFHGAWNLLMAIIILLSLQFVSDDLHIAEGDGYKLEWKRAPFLESNEGSYSPEGKVADYQYESSGYSWDREPKFIGFFCYFGAIYEI
jgi:hypothetical protein